MTKIGNNISKCLKCKLTSLFGEDKHTLTLGYYFCCSYSNIVMKMVNTLYRKYGYKRKSNLEHINKPFIYVINQWIFVNYRYYTSCLKSKLLFQSTLWFRKSNRHLIFFFFHQILYVWPSVAYLISLVLRFIFPKIILFLYSECVSAINKHISRALASNALFSQNHALDE